MKIEVPGFEVRDLGSRVLGQILGFGVLLGF